MDAEAPTRGDHIKASVFWLIVILGLGYVFPRFVGVLLMLFSVLVFVLAVIGLVWPSVMRLPNRLASAWIFAVSVGLFVGGGVLMSPQNGEPTVADMPPVAAEPSDDLVERLRRAEGRGACNTRLQETVFDIADERVLFRWTTVHLDIRFPGRRETSNPDVVTYWGRALQLMTAAGTWEQTTYECDYNHRTGQIVDVRAR